MKRAALAVALVASLGEHTVFGCVVTLSGYQPPTGIGAVQVVAHDFPSWGGFVVDRAMNDWNQPSCNGGGGTDFPLFQTQSGGPQVHVFWNPGIAPAGLGAGACASMNRETRFINLYASTRDQNGVVHSCGDQHALADNLAHELGHYLGLGDAPSYCGPSLLMSAGSFDAQGNRLLRDPVAAECGRADELNETPMELAAPPDDPFCDAYCWTSCVGGVCPTRPPSYEGCPVLLDLERNGIRLTGLENPVWFDIDADGALDRLSWTDGEDAFLVLDRNEDGWINDGAELFGNYTLLAEGSRAPNGYEALAEFDLPDYGGNGDGWIDARDWVYGYLRVWSDVNHNGLSEPGEVQTLTDAGVVQIDWHYRRTQRRDRHGNELRFKSRARVLGPVGHAQIVPTWDVFFVIDRQP